MRIQLPALLVIWSLAALPPVAAAQTPQTDLPEWETLISDVNGSVQYNRSSLSWTLGFLFADVLFTTGDPPTEESSRVLLYANCPDNRIALVYVRHTDSAGEVRVDAHRPPFDRREIEPDTPQQIWFDALCHLPVEQ